MGLFSKKKEENSGVSSSGSQGNQMPPAPGSKSQNSTEMPPSPPSPDSQSQGGEMPPAPGSQSQGMPPSPSSGSQGGEMPPAPGSQSQGGQGQQTSETQSPNSALGSMPEPPRPNGGLDEIKSQISQNEMGSSSTQLSGSSQQQDSSDDLDSLFDISDINNQLPSDNNTNQQNTQSGSDYVEEPQEHTTDEDMKFLQTRDRGVSPSESTYITTSQFKTLLEIVEEVKLKAKDSTERHLRLLDIKSEEDIEFENLKKDFAYIEDKLYEVDNLIFEK